MRLNKSIGIPYRDFLQHMIAAHGTSDECLIWPFVGAATHGRGSCWFEGKLVLAYRLAFFYSNGRWPEPQGRHTCDIPACVNPRHIVEGTNKQNGADMVSRGRAARGVKHGMSKLTDEAVRQMRIDYARERPTFSQIATKYGVAPMTAYGIIKRRFWTHV